MCFLGGVKTLIEPVVYGVFWRHFRGGAKTLIKPVIYDDFWGVFSPMSKVLDALDAGKPYKT